MLVLSMNNMDTARNFLIGVIESCDRTCGSRFEGMEPSTFSELEQPSDRDSLNFSDVICSYFSARSISSSVCLQ